VRHGHNSGIAKTAKKSGLDVSQYVWAWFVYEAIVFSCLWRAGQQGEQSQDRAIREQAGFD
jgi:hypothetical protein